MLPANGGPVCRVAKHSGVAEGSPRQQDILSHRQGRHPGHQGDRSDSDGHSTERRAVAASIAAVPVAFSSDSLQVRLHLVFDPLLLLRRSHVRQRGRGPGLAEQPVELGCNILVG